MGRITWHQATPQRLEPVGPDRDYGTGVTRRTHRAAPGRRHRNSTTAVSSYDTCVGPDQPRSQPAGLTRTVTLPATALIRLSTRSLTSCESLRNQVMSGAEVRTVTVCQCLMDTVLNVPLRVFFTLSYSTGSDLILGATVW